jgi:hypothetical protein
MGSLDTSRCMPTSLISDLARLSVCVWLSWRVGNYGLDSLTHSLSLSISRTLSVCLALARAASHTSHVHSLSRTHQVITHIGAFFDMQVQAGSNCQCHTQECTCRFSYKDLQQHILECDKSMTCTLKPLPPLSSDGTSFSIPSAPQFKE